MRRTAIGWSPRLGHVPRQALHGGGRGALCPLGTGRGNGEHTHHPWVERSVWRVAPLVTGPGLRRRSRRARMAEAPNASLGSIAPLVASRCGRGRVPMAAMVWSTVLEPAKGLAPDGLNNPPGLCPQA